MGPAHRGTLSPISNSSTSSTFTPQKLDEEDVYDSLQQVPLLDYVQPTIPKFCLSATVKPTTGRTPAATISLLRSTHDIDHFIEQLWNAMQSIPAYRDQTTFIVTADHGRGSGLTEWKDHGAKQKGSENIWIAIIGPDTQPLGERTNMGTITQSQIAATLAVFWARIISTMSRRPRRDCRCPFESIPCSPGR